VQFFPLSCTFHSPPSVFSSLSGSRGYNMSSPEPLRRRDPQAPPATQQPIGIDSVLAQKANKTLYHGIPWNCMIVGTCILAKRLGTRN